MVGTCISNWNSPFFRGHSLVFGGVYRRWLGEPNLWQSSRSVFDGETRSPNISPCNEMEDLQILSARPNKFFMTTEMLGYDFWKLAFKKGKFRGSFETIGPSLKKSPIKFEVGKLVSWSYAAIIWKSVPVARPHGTTNKYHFMGI